MKIFDGHADLFHDVTRRVLNGEKDILRKHHLERLKKGGIHGGIFISWIPERDYNKNPIQDPKAYFEFMVENVEKELLLSKDFVEIITKKEELDKFFQDEKIYVLKGMEGLKVVDEELELLDYIYRLGYRHLSLTWNEENILATGVRGNETRGLTELGKKALKKIEDLGMVIDVSHLNEKSFWDVMNNTSKTIIASHSNAYTLCNTKRNLTDAQLRAIGERGGLVGINAYREFLSDVDEERTIDKLADHVDYIVNLIGCDHVGFGFDFCEYLYSGCGKMNPDGLEDASYVPQFIEKLKMRGYTEEEIEKMSYKNFLRIFREILK